MKCPYCNRRMFKDEETGIKTCYSCEQKNKQQKKVKKIKNQETLKALEMLVNNVFK